MKKIGVAVGEEMWTFFKEIYNDLTQHFEVSVFQKKEHNIPILYGKLNRWSYHQGVNNFLKSNDLCFFEWASEHLMKASQMSIKKPIVTRLHSFEIYDWAPKINWDSIDKVILVSKFMQKKFSELYPRHAYKSIVINNGQPLEIFKPPSQRVYTKTLGMLCTITPVKRIYEIILMLYELRKTGLQVKLRIAGKPKENNDARYPIAIYDLVKKLSLEESVTFDGFVSDAHLWLKKIDIYISNSYWEGQQVALIEAMASGCFCLSHIWGGADEMLPPDNLFITNSELQQKIIDFYQISDDEKISRSMRLRDIAIEKFDIEQTKQQIQEVIEEVFKNH